MWSASSCFIRLLWLWCQPHCLVTVDMNLWTACVAGFWGVNGYSVPVSAVISFSYSLPSILRSRRGTLIPLQVRAWRQCAVVLKFPENSISTRFILVATCRAKAYLLIWLALLAEKERIILRRSDPTSILHSFQTALFVWCLEWLMIIVWSAPPSYWKEKEKVVGCEGFYDTNRWRQAGRMMAAESDDITPIGRLWEKTC